MTPGGPGDGPVGDPEELPRTASGEVDVDAIKEADDASQCVKTTIGPCPCNQGGQPIAINERYLELFQEENSGRERAVCPQVVLCTDAEPTLENGSCTLNT
jgi:hypothetical protein